ncbi:hypothetical protein AKJ42_03850, partial [candidate division MSBL1 archaeon SCGC-AAA261C02]
RNKLVYGIEGKCSRTYNTQLMTQFPEFLQVKKRNKYKAEEPLNNTFNLAYEVLKAEVYRGVMKAHLDPFLGYLHSIQYSKPSLVCDLQEPFRPMIDEFLIKYSQDLDKDDFEKRGERMFLNQEKGYELIQSVNELLDKRVEHQRITNFGESSKIRTMIREEAIKLSQYLKGEKEEYKLVSKNKNLLS